MERSGREGMGRTGRGWDGEHRAGRDGEDQGEGPERGTRGEGPGGDPREGLGARWPLIRASGSPPRRPGVCPGPDPAAAP